MSMGRRTSTSATSSTSFPSCSSGSRSGYEEGLPRPRPWAWVIVAVCCILTGAHADRSTRLQRRSSSRWRCFRGSASMPQPRVTSPSSCCCSRSPSARVWAAVRRQPRRLSLVGYRARHGRRRRQRGLLQREAAPRTPRRAFSGRAADLARRGRASPDRDVAVLWKQEGEGAAVNAEYPADGHRVLQPEPPGRSTDSAVRRTTRHFSPPSPLPSTRRRTPDSRAGAPIAPDYVLVTCRMRVVGEVLGAVAARVVRARRCGATSPHAARQHVRRRSALSSEDVGKPDDRFTSGGACVGAA